MRKILHTTASESYDYSYCVRTPSEYAYLKHTFGAPPVEVPMFKVSIPEENFEYQMGRYISGLEVTHTEEEIEAELMMDYAFPYIKKLVEGGGK